MSESWHPHNGLLAPVLGVSAVLEEWLSLNSQAVLLTTDDLRRWQLGGLLLRDNTRLVGSAGEMLPALVQGVTVGAGRGVIIAPVTKLIGQLAPGGVAIAVSDDGFTESKLIADHVLWPADVHQAAAALRWALETAQAGESVVIYVSSRPVPLVWSHNTKFSPDRWVTVGAGDTLILAFGSAMAPVRAVMENDKRAIRAINITDCLGDQVARQAIRALVVGSSKVFLVRPPQGGSWLADVLLTIKKDFTDLVLKPDWRGVVDYSSDEHSKVIVEALKKRS